MTEQSPRHEKLSTEMNGEAGTAHAEFAADSLTEGVQSLYETTKDTIVEGVDSLREMIQEHPLRSMMVAFCAGGLIAWMARHKRN